MVVLLVSVEEDREKQQYTATLYIDDQYHTVVVEKRGPMFSIADGDLLPLLHNNFLLFKKVFRAIVEKLGEGDAGVPMPISIEP